MNDVRTRILQFTTQPVEHPTEELGTVYIRRLTLGELDKMQADNKAAPKPGDVPIPTTVRLLARFLGDEKGAPLFDLDKPEDRDTLLAFPVSLAADLLRVGTKINKMDDEKPGEEKNA
jgi:hypothetical protein